MGLTEVQRVLAQLYTNVDLREQFLLNPQEVANKFNLTSTDIEHLTALSAFHLREFANSLQYKRLGEVSKILNLTEKVLKKKFRELFLKFTNNYLPSGVKKHRDDAIAFAKFISISKDADLPMWSKELALYEATRLELSEIKSPLKVKIFNYPLKKIISAILEEKEVFVEKRLTLALWIKIPGQHRWYHRLF
jgi:hypothetical protein